MAKITASDRKWIEAHGGKVGVVSEAEARQRESQHKARQEAASALGEIPPRTSKVPLEAYDIELPGDRPTPTKGTQPEAARDPADVVIQQERRKAEAGYDPADVVIKQRWAKAREAA